MADSIPANQFFNQTPPNKKPVSASSFMGKGGLTVVSTPDIASPSTQKPSVGNNLKTLASQTGSETMGDIKQIGTDFNAHQQEAKSIDDNPKLNIGGKILGNIANAAGGMNDLIGDTLNAAGLGQIIKGLPGIDFSTGKITTLDKSIASGITQIKKAATQIKAVQDMSTNIQSFLQNHPNDAEGVKALVNSFGTLLNATGIGDLMGAASKDVATTAVKDATSPAIDANATESAPKDATTEKPNAETKETTPAEENKPPLKPRSSFKFSLNPVKIGEQVLSKGQQALTSVSSIVKGGIGKIADTLSAIKDPAQLAQATNALRSNFYDIMDSAKASLSDTDALKPHEVTGENAVKPAMDELQNQEQQVGQKIGEYKAAIGSKVVPGIKNIYENLKSDVESVFKKKFSPAGFGPSMSNDTESILKDTGNVSVNLGGAQKDITKALTDLSKITENGTVDDLNAVKSNMGQILDKIGLESPSLQQQVKRVFTKTYKEISSALDSTAKESGISDFNQMNEAYSDYKKYGTVLKGITDNAGDINYSKISEQATSSGLKKTIDFLQSKTGIPVRAYSELATWAQSAYSDSKVNDLLKTVIGKTSGLPMMGMGRQIINLFGDVPGKTFSEIDAALDGKASEIKDAITGSKSLSGLLKTMKLTPTQGAVLLIDSVNDSTSKEQEEDQQ